MKEEILGKYQKFVFEGYNYAFQSEEETLLIKLSFSFDSTVKFEEKLTLKVDKETWFKVNLKALDKALDGLLLIAGISYYKAFCPKTIVQESVPMNQEMADFWNKLYERGLGEFFYQNKIDFRGLINFKKNTETEEEGMTLNLKESAFLPIGGGKDSIVSAEILKNGGMDFVSFSLRDAKAIKESAEKIGKPRIVVGRELDAELFKLNDEGALNGHVPITAYISFLLVVCAVIYDFKYLIFSFEKSANFGELDWYGMDVNHQYSKSEEFEKDFRDYIAKHVSPEIEYFSLLRGYFELRIVEIFTGLENLNEYLPVFSSCNANFKIIKEKSATKWCGECPKCAFVFLCMAAFLDKQKLVSTFGKNLFEDEKLVTLFEELWGIKNFKPFECVGTPEECLVAMKMVSEKKEFDNDFIVKYFMEKILTGLNNNWDVEKENLLKMQKGHFIPAKLENLLKKYNYAN